GVPEGLQSGIVRYGFHAARIALAERTLQSHPPRASAASFEWRAIASGWASRGAWEKALAAADSAMTADPKPFVALFGYRLAVVGAWLHALEPSAATIWR